MNGRGNVVVVGGGITGLSVAFWLHRAGVDVTVLEQDAVVGGTMKTTVTDGWLVETGPNSALETTPLFRDMFDTLGILGERLYADSSSSRRYILRRGELHALPLSPPAFLTTRLWSAPAKLRLLREPFIGRGTKEESIAEFVERRLGREFLDYAINPFVAGVYAGNPEELSVRTAFPKLYALEARYGGLIRGMIGGARERKRRAETAKDRAKMFSFAGGMQTFPASIGAFLGGRVRTGRRVLSVTRRESGFAVVHDGRGTTEEMHAGVVVLSVPSRAAAAIVRPFSAALADTLARIYYPPVAEVFTGFKLEQISRPLDGFGYLVPAKEGRKILGTIWSSALFPGRAPSGHAALTTFVGGSRQPDLAGLDDDALRSVVVSEIRSIMGVRGEPVYTKIVRWPEAIPQYNLGYSAVLDAIDRLEAGTPGLYLSANYRGGIAVGDCVMSGEKTAGRILSQMGIHKAHSMTSQEKHR